MRNQQEKSTTKTVQYRLTGRVQQVGFRYYLQDIAKKHGLVGWTQNNLDGSINFCFQGSDEAAINTAVQAAKKGPALSKVNSNQQEQPTTTIIYTNFTILR